MNSPLWSLSKFQGTSRGPQLCFRCVSVVVEGVSEGLRKVSNVFRFRGGGWCGGCYRGTSGVSHSFQGGLRG